MSTASNQPSTQRMQPVNASHWVVAPSHPHLAGTLGTTLAVLTTPAQATQMTDTGFAHHMHMPSTCPPGVTFACANQCITQHTGLTLSEVTECLAVVCKHCRVSSAPLKLDGHGLRC
jgi:hypothetical protein